LNTKDISENIGNQLTAQTSKGNFFSCRQLYGSQHYFSVQQRKDTHRFGTTWKWV